MSNKADATNMIQATQRELMPKLRFPEFRDDWIVKILGDLGKLIGGGTPDKSVVEYWQGDIPWVSSSDIFEDDIYTMSVTRFINEKSISESATKLVPKGSVLFVSRVGTGKLAVNDKDVCTSQDFTNFLPKKIYNYFLGYFFIANKSALISLGQGTSIKGFSKGDLEKFEVIFPSPLEQEKIADCLSSIDDLITAQTQKLDTLKTHKKGLMQQLFPAEGETLPKLRFPEFRDTPTWKERTLNEIADLYKGKGISKADIDVQGKVPCIRYGELYTIYSEVIETVFSKTSNPPSDLFFSRKNDVIIPASGETKIDIAKASCVMHDNVALGGDLNVIRSSHNGVFLSYYLNGPKKVDIAKIAQGDTVVHLYPSQLQLLEIGLPIADEQKKIADCLSSIDELITAQTHKLATLKTHKKGLMQQLFPALDEVQR